MSFLLRSIEPATGPTQGGNVVRLLGEGIAPTSCVWMGGLPARVLLIRGTTCYAQAPAHSVGAIDVEMLSAGRRHVLVEGYRYVRPDLTQESDLTRLVRALLQQLKHHVAQSTSLTVDINYAGSAAADDPAAVLANLPTLLLTGPELHENRTLCTNVGYEQEDAGGNFLGYAPPYTVDLAFNLVGASATTVELLNLLSATVVFLQHASHVALHRDAALPDAGWVRWPLHQTGDTRTHFDGPDGVKTFSCTFAVQGFDLTSAQPQMAGSRIDSATLTATPGGFI